MTHQLSIRLLRPVDALPKETGSEQSDCPCYDARALAGPGGEAEIVLDGKTYHLRITRQGKLILTK